MTKGYRINYPEEVVAWKVLRFEYEELHNEHILDNLSDFLGVKGDWQTVLSIFQGKYGDTRGIWLTRSREAAIEYYGDYGGDLLIYEYDPKFIISDLGDDGFFVLNATFIEKNLGKIKQGSYYHNGRHR